MPYTAFALIIPLLALGCALPLGASPAERTLVVCSHHHRLSVVARDALMSEVLDVLSRVCGIRFYFYDADRTRVNLSAYDVEIEQGLKSLFKDRDTIFVYSPRDSARITAVYVYGRRSGSLAWLADPGLDNPSQDEVDFAARRAELTRQVEAVEDVLRSDAGLQSLKVPLPPGVLADPEPAIRVTALQWSAGRGEAFMDALAVALVDSDMTVQVAARELLLERGVAREGMDRLLAIAEAGDETALRSLLPTYLDGD
ncbi:MAG: hypothetical protein ACREV1_05770 [Gammaproteobacteria bacterium]